MSVSWTDGRMADATSQKLVWLVAQPTSVLTVKSIRPKSVHFIVCSFPGLDATQASRDVGVALGLAAVVTPLEESREDRCYDGKRAAEKEFKAHVAHPILRARA